MEAQGDGDQFSMESEKSLQELIVLLADWYWKQDSNYRFTLIRGGGYGSSVSEIFLGKTPWELDFIPVNNGGNWDEYKKVLEARQPFSDFVCSNIDQSGQMHYLSSSGRPCFNADGTFDGYHGITKDVTQRVEAEKALLESETRFRSLIEFSSDWYWEQDEQFRFSYMPAAAFEKAGHLASAIHGKTRWELKEATPLSGTWDDHRRILEAHMPFRDFEYRRIADDGVLRYSSNSGMPVFDENGNFKGYRGVGRDITASKLAAERIHYLATHDGLTGLPNRSHFSDILNKAINTAKRYGRKFAVLFIDLDRFKLINDTLGHDAGDALLIEVAKRLTLSIRESDVVARLGGDEFVVMMAEINSPEDVNPVADKILSAMATPFMLVGSEYRISASVGACIYPLHAQDEQTLMKHADAAMYQAKENGKNNHQMYSTDIQSASQDRLTLETNLRDAIDRQEFFLHYQAKLDLDTGEIKGVEALLRWRHPSLGVIMPHQFIPLAEETGMIVPIGKWVLSTACAQNVAWQRAGLASLCMAVNLTTRQFNDVNLLDIIATALKESGLSPQFLELELSENMVMQNAQRTMATLAALKSIGVRLAVDNFGVGYSSLAQIKRFPIDAIKIDHSFIRDIVDNIEDQAITTAIISMGKMLDMKVIAGGVETLEQKNFLLDQGCN
ncbi:MAG: putative bifunctional diguanylate cyclase/phosphodiesterase, partial [Burkholderiaceae bacterium]